MSSPQDLIHGRHSPKLSSPVLDLQNVGDTRQEDDRHGAGQRLHSRRPLPGLELIQPSHGQLPQRPNLHHHQQCHSALQEQHQEQQLNHPHRLKINTQIFDIWRNFVILKGKQLSWITNPRSRHKNTHFEDKRLLLLIVEEEFDGWRWRKMRFWEAKTEIRQNHSPLKRSMDCFPSFRRQKGCSNGER